MSCSNCNCSDSASCGGCCQDNPCTPCPEESANCETLPSALENFIKSFYGSVTRTVVNGKVQWSLPCNLESGLPSNPRGTDEGLACYFLRLFNDGIIGLQGPTGQTGATGQDGFNAFSVLVVAATQPSLAAPSWTATVLGSPVFEANQVVYVHGSGWSRVELVSGNGSQLSLTLLESTGSAGSTLPIGTLVMVAGPKGQPGTAVAKGDPGVDSPVFYPVTIKNPTNAEDFTLGFNDAERTVSSIRAVIRGSSVPGVTWTIRYGADRASAGTEVKIGGVTTTDINSGDNVTVFDNAVIPANVWVWLETTSVSGSVNELSVTVLV